MTIEAAGSSARGEHKNARKAGVALLAGVAVLTMAGCSAGETVTDGWWDNGDPIRIPAKSALFDAEGVALCETPTAFGTVETRSRSYSELGGVINAFLFEIVNPETDPATAGNREEQRKLEDLQDSLGAMYQLTNPAFDVEYGISGPEDMRAVKDELQAHLPDLLTEGTATSYVKVDDQWLEGPEGRFSVRRAPDPEVYIKENGINTTFRGAINTYWIATRDDGTEFLLVRNKEDGTATLMRGGEPNVLLDESTESYTRYNIENESTGVNPDATITLVNDQCLPIDRAQVARYWVYDYELLNGTEQQPNVIE